jgi:hypothetical protein
LVVSEVEFGHHGKSGDGVDVVDLVATCVKGELLSCSLSSLGKLSVMKLSLVRRLSASSMFFIFYMPSLEPRMISQLASSIFYSISDSISFSFL